MQETVSFGPFQFSPAKRLLEHGGTPVEIGSRTLDLLLVLLERPGEVVDKRALLDRVWAGATVEEGSLRVQVAALRRALGERPGGERYIGTVAGRGYAFVGRTERTPGEASPSVLAMALPTIPPLLTEVVGREAEVQEALRLQAAHRVLTLVGPGGIGKTTLALVVVRHLASAYASAVRWADLAPLTEPALVVPTIASSLGLQRMPQPLTVERIAEFVGTARMLLVIDNCEHLVEPVADLAEALLHASGIDLLVTSQEPLRVAGECVYRVPPLATDEAAAGGTGAQDLFLARARAANPSLVIDGNDLETVAIICRRLDGIPLAIELAAARTALIGLHAVAARLNHRFDLLCGGRRTAAPRQQTMRAALQWSIDLLSPRQKEVLERLGIFVGSFPLDAAEAVAADPDHPADLDVCVCVADLVTRSLLGRESAPHESRLRLLETVRAYLQERPEQSTAISLHQRHLRFYAKRMRLAAEEWSALVIGQWMARYERDLENVRAALEWSLTTDEASSEDIRLGVRLAAASMPLWQESSLHAEAQSWAQRALASGLAEPEDERALQIALGMVLLNTAVLDGQTTAAFRRGLDLSDVAGDVGQTLRALYGLWVQLLRENEYEEAHEVAARFRRTAGTGGDRAAMRAGDRMIGISEHYLGHQVAARARLESWLRNLPSGNLASRESRFGLDQKVAGLTALARVVALQAELDRAKELAELATEEARRLARTASLCHALGESCILALWAHDAAGLTHASAALAESVDRHGMPFWRPHVRVALGCLRAWEGDAEAAAARFAEAMRDICPHRFDLVYASLAASVADGLRIAGRVAAARALLTQALGRPRAMHRFNTPALLVVRGRVTLDEGGRDAETMAEADFRQAIEHARSQSALLLERQAEAAAGALRPAARAVVIGKTRASVPR